jgi:tetratricopeptide (TPR) repeat protein
MRVQRAFGLAAIPVRLALVAAFLFVAGGAPRSDWTARWVASGEQAARQGHTDAALAAYKRDMNPQVVIYERLVLVCLDAGRYDDAQVYLYALADLNGWNAERRDQLRRIFEHNGATRRANALLYALPEGSLPAPQVLRNLVQEQINRLEWEQAETTLGQLLAFDPGDMQALYQLALLLAPVDQNYAREYLGRVVHDPALAVRAETIRAALDVYNVSALTDAHTYLGVTLVGLGEWPFAERALRMALEVNSVNPIALAYLGFARDQQGRDGLPDLEAALAMAPNEPTIHYLVGQHWRQAGRHDKEYEAFTRAYWLSPDNPALAVEVGVALQNQSDLAGAEQWLRRAVELDPDDLQWRRVLAAFYADTAFQLEPTGLAFIEESNQIAPDDSDIRASLGWAYYQANDPLRAYDELSTAVGLDPNNPRTRYYFGAVLEQRGDQQGAADSYWFVVEELGPDAGFGLLAARALQRLGYAQ